MNKTNKLNEILCHVQSDYIINVNDRQDYDFIYGKEYQENVKNIETSEEYIQANYSRIDYLYLYQHV